MAVGLAALLTIFSSCSSRLGWGVVLWTEPDGPLPAGSVVPVYIKSNIEKVYVVGVPGSKVKGKKVEIELWQIELFKSKSKAIARVKAMGDNVSLYMTAARDGLFVRDKPDNVTGARVYRLRQGQSVKILEKVDGVPVSTGGQSLSGSWYRVLTDDGAIGYTFSHDYRLYDETKEGPPVLAAAKEALSGRVDLVFSRSWRPEYFQEMIDDDRVDLDYFSLRYGLFVDAIRRQIRLELPAASEIFNYSGISESKGTYSFEGSPLRIKIESDSRMVCSWGAAQGEEARTDSSEADAIAAPAAQAAPSDRRGSVDRSGSGDSAAFVVLSVEPREAIRLEALRRQKLLTAFADEAGASWSAPEAGRLVLNKNGRFTWAARGAAAAAFVPEGAGEGGEISFRAYVDPALAAEWSGSLSLRFDPAAPNSPRQDWADFLYRRSPAGLVLAPASVSGLIAQAASAGAAPLILQSAAE